MDAYLNDTNIPAVGDAGVSSHQTRRLLFTIGDKDEGEMGRRAMGGICRIGGDSIEDEKAYTLELDNVSLVKVSDIRITDGGVGY